MKLRRYCVTVMDNWTRTRMFFTFGAALRYKDLHNAGHLFRWHDGEWLRLVVSPMPQRE